MFVGNLAKVCVLYTTGFGSECDKYIQIFECIGHEYYSDIRSYRFFFHEYIRTFVRVKFV